MRCPNCGADYPQPLPSDNGTTTCPRCAYRFPIAEAADELPPVHIPRHAHEEHEETEREPAHSGSTS